MKKRILFSLVAILIIISFIQIPALAYTPTSPGLWVETTSKESGVKFATNPNVKGYHDPTNVDYKNNDAELVSNINNKTVTVNVPNSARFVMFRYWDYGNPTNGYWITGGTVSYSINGNNVTGQHIVGGLGSDGRITSGGVGVATKNYIAFSTDKFDKIDDKDTFTVRVVRIVAGARYDYTITYNINWDTSMSGVEYK